MSKKKLERDSSEILRSIVRLGSDADWSEAELREELLQEGVDPDKLVENALATVRGALRNSPFHWRNRAKAFRERYGKKFEAERWRNLANVARPGLLERVRVALARLPSQVVEQCSLDFRNFEECSNEDLISIIAELEMIEDSQAESEG